MGFIFPDWQDVPLNVGALSTLRSGGVSLPPYHDGAGGGGLNLGIHVGDRAEDVQSNRALLRASLPAEPAWLSQVHGATVVNAANIAGVPDADASIATEPGVVCVIQTADCLPVLFCDLDGHAVGAAHAGWRGLAGGVLENTVIAMQNAGAKKIVAWLGPAIGPQKFEVGQDVLETFIQHDKEMLAAFDPVVGQKEKYLTDIYRLARKVLTNIGIRKVYGGKFCTMTDQDQFYSYRRDRVTGRMASLIWLSPQ